MHQPNAHVPTPEITVDASGTARSLTFDDVYFSARGGVAETEHVFLAGNQLPSRWRDRARFTIGELGFGTGLNFLVAWKQFAQSQPQGHLHFISVEKFPLTVEQLQAALQHHPELRAYSEPLLAAYPLRLPGWHRVHFDRVTLTLGFGDAKTLLPELDAAVDAWFLDGFSPAKNETMWSPTIFRQLARLSAQDATFATFTVAGAVRRGLAEVGFACEKTTGFAHKREMLIGRFTGADAAQTPRAARTAIVVGGGIAGCTIARALAEQGCAVTLLEQSALAAGASGNPAAVLYPQLTKYYTAATVWHFTAYAFMLRQLQRWQQQGLRFAHAQPGMLKIAKDEADDARLRSIRSSLQLDPAIARWVEAPEASALTGQTLARGGFWFAQGSWLAPAELCAALVQHAAITVRKACAVQSVASGQVTLANGMVMQADAIVLANAQGAASLLPQHGWNMGISAGQVSAVAADALPPLQAILCHKGYAISLPDRLLIGATYDRADLSGAVTDANHAHNMAELAEAVPTVNPQAAIMGGRTSMRATTPSRLPYVGAVMPGVYASVGHGSRGMISAPLAAEILAAEIMGGPSPVGRGLRALLDPKRG